MGKHYDIITEYPFALGTFGPPGHNQFEKNEFRQLVVIANRADSGCCVAKKEFYRRFYRLLRYLDGNVSLADGLSIIGDRYVDIQEEEQ